MIPSLPWFCRLELSPKGINHAYGKTTRTLKGGRTVATVYLEPDVDDWMERMYAALIARRDTPRLAAGQHVVIWQKYRFPHDAWDVDAQVKLTQDILRDVFRRRRPFKPGTTTAEQRRALRQQDGREFDDKDVRFEAACKLVDLAQAGIDICVDWDDVGSTEAYYDDLLQHSLDRPRNAFGIPLPLPRRRNLALVQGLIEEGA